MPVLRIFAPTIFFSGILGVLRGYFQAHGTMIPTSFSQILEQILNAVISILAAFLLMRMVAGQDDTTIAIYGASGSAIGTGAGVLVALLFMLFILALNRRILAKQVRRDRSGELLETPEVFRIIITMVTPIILSTFIYNCNSSLNLTIYTRIMEYVRGVSEADAYTQYGLFSGKAKQISNIPIALASAMSTAMIPGISGSFARKDIRETNRKIAMGGRAAGVICGPAGGGVAAVAGPVVLLLYPQKGSVDMVSWLLAGLSISVVFYAVSTISNGVLQGIGKVNLPVINAAIALVVQTVVLVLLLLFTDLGLHSLVIATVLYSFLMCILNGFSVKRQLGYRQEAVKTFCIPFWASVIMGGAAFSIYHGLYLLLPVNVVCLAAALPAAAALYFVLVIKMGAVEERDLLALPKGAFLAAMARRFRLIP